MLTPDYDDADIQRARRAYYGSISYLDGLVGQLVEVIEATGRADDTVIVFTSDHGDMLGERGMWFKKHFYEPSLRVPLLISGGGFEPMRVDTLVSLVDLLPTFMGVAEGAGWTSPVEDLDGVDLATALDGAHTDRAVYAEYLAEAALSPILMIRRGPYKFISSTEDPPLLFNLVDDPLERVNLADDPKNADLVADFTAEVDAKWDRAALTHDILQSQRRLFAFHQ